MEKGKILAYAFMNSFFTAVYIIAISFFMNYIGSYIEKSNDVFGMISILMFFVISAAITGSLVLGRPILWYFSGKKKEGVYLIVFTLGILIIIAILIFLLIISFF